MTTFYWWLRFYTQILYHLSKKEVLHYITLNGEAMGLWTSDHPVLKHYSWFSSVTLWYYLLLKSVEVIVIQPCLTHCNPMDCSPPGSSVHGILQARVLAWVTMPSSRESSQPRDWTQASHTAGRFFTIWATREALITPYSPGNPASFYFDFFS